MQIGFNCKNLQEVTEKTKKTERWS